METQQLGPIQKEWVKDLRENGHLQIKGKLGERDEDSNICGLCCLGQGLVTLSRLTGKQLLWMGKSLVDTYITASLIESYSKLGLRSPSGLTEDQSQSLAGMNDSGKTWTEIADYIEANPEKVFTEAK